MGNRGKRNAPQPAPKLSRSLCLQYNKSAAAPLSLPQVSANGNFQEASCPSAPEEVWCGVRKDLCLILRAL